MSDNDVRYGINNVIRGLWRNWAISLGLIILVNMMSLWVAKRWIPITAFSGALVLYSMIRINHESRLPLCNRIAYLSMLTLFWSGIIMIGINLSVSKWLADTSFSLSPFNPRIPYINILILGPVATLVSGWSIFRGGEQSFCKNCRIIYGEASERGFLGNIFRQEGEYLVWMFFVMSFFVTVCGYIYYFVFYINVNLNSPDKFFFVWAPSIIYLSSLLFLGMRYAGLWVYYAKGINGSSVLQGRMTIIRYLIMCGDEIYLNFPEPNKDSLCVEDEKIDTPARLSLPYKEQVGDYEAEMCFKGLSAISPAMIRYLYMSDCYNTGGNIFHFACVLDSVDQIKGSRCAGEWISLGTLQRLTTEGRVSPLLCAEIDRIYQVTMAWKSYDRKGYRLYDIKNYKPTFRLRDFRNWDVDYNDSNWLFVAANNEDRPFFRIRRLWRKFINGTAE